MYIIIHFYHVCVIILLNYYYIVLFEILLNCIQQFVYGTAGETKKKWSLTGPIYIYTNSAEV